MATIDACLPATMTAIPLAHQNSSFVNSFEELVQMPLLGEMNAVCWQRQLAGNFEELVNKLSLAEDTTEITARQLLSLHLTQEGNLARALILNDLARLEAHGAAPQLNLIKQYQRDDEYSFFPRDVYSFHVDKSPIPLATFLCTYYGASSELVPNAQAQQKIHIPAIRKALQEIYSGAAGDFENFLSENFFDLHYQAIAGAEIQSFGQGNMWRIAAAYPNSEVLPCLHRAPLEEDLRLMVIC